MADTYTLRFRNSNEKEDVLLHPEADLGFCQTHMRLYVQSWDGIKNINDRIRKGRTWVMLERADGYTLKVWYSKNKLKEANEETRR